MEATTALTWRDIDDLPKIQANYMSLTPLWFLDRAAAVHPTRKSVIHGSLEYTWRQTYDRCRRLASALANRSIGPGSTVAIIAPNIPAMYEAHFGVPMSGAVLTCINIRLNATTIAFLLSHSQCSVLLVDQELFTLAEESLTLMDEKLPLLIVIGDHTCPNESLNQALSKGVIDYESFLKTGDSNYQWQPPADEWQSIALSYTSGTTASPKGVVLHHRGAYLTALSNPVTWGMQEGSVYLWTLPMFHANGWCFPWSLAAISGTSICLRQVTAKEVYSSIDKYKVTHFCAAPVVLNIIVNAPKEDIILPLPHIVHVMTAGAAPPPSVLLSMNQKGFKVTHVYGLSETIGPATICAWKPEWDLLPPMTQAQLNARQGIRSISIDQLDVLDTRTGKPVPADGKTTGEIVIRGNMVMKGYLKNPEANKEAFADGWFHTGDIAVKHPDNYIEIKDRLKDVIISGGENISSVEVENVVYHHPAVLEASVVARPDERWQESPCAFVTVKSGYEKCDKEKLAQEIMRFCREKLPAYWVPKSVVFGALPKTGTGKIQKHILRNMAKEMGPVKRTRL